MKQGAKRPTNQKLATVARVHDIEFSLLGVGRTKKLVAFSEISLSLSLCRALSVFLSYARASLDKKMSTENTNQRTRCLAEKRNGVIVPTYSINKNIQSYWLAKTPPDLDL